MSKDNNKPGVPERVRIHCEESCARRTDVPDDGARQHQAATRAVASTLTRCGGVCRDRTLA